MRLSADIRTFPPSLFQIVENKGGKKVPVEQLLVNFPEMVENGAKGSDIC